MSPFFWQNVPVLLAVLVFQFLEPLDLRGLQPPVRGFPLVLRRGANPVVPPDLIDRAAGVGLFQDRYDLGLGGLRLTHGNLLARVTIVPDVLLLTASIYGELTDLHWAILPLLYWPGGLMICLKACEQR